MASLFCELNEPDDRKKEFQNAIAIYGAACEAVTRFLVSALELMTSTAESDKRHYPGVVFLLSKHAAEQLDAISVLIGNSCVEPCKQQLRSILEASLGVRYVLEADSENRSLAYHLANFHRRIEACQKLDLTDPVGIDFRKSLESDATGSEIIASIPQAEITAERRRLEDALQKSPLDAIETEWQRTRKAIGRAPAWHALFGGPRSTRKLAIRLGRLFWYEFVYSDWSEAVHGTGVAKHVGRIAGDPAGNGEAIKTIRHPEGIEIVCNYAWAMASEIEELISKEFLGRIGQDYLQRMYVREVQPAIQKALQIRMVASWK